MTEDQERRIAEIKKQWGEEVDKIPDESPRVKGFDESLNKPYRELEKKYLPMIREIMNER